MGLVTRWQQTRPAENAPTVGVPRAGKTSWAEAWNEDYTLLSQSRGIHDLARWRSFLGAFLASTESGGASAPHGRVRSSVPAAQKAGQGPNLPPQRCRRPEPRGGAGIACPVLNALRKAGIVCQPRWYKHSCGQIMHRERERRQREEGLSRNGAPRGWGLQVGRLAAGWAPVKGVAGGPWHALVRVGCLRQARDTKLGDEDWHEDRTKMEGLLSPMRTKVGKDVNVFRSWIYPRRGRGVAGLALWIGGLPGFCLFSFPSLFFPSSFSKLWSWM